MTREPVVYPRERLVDFVSAFPYHDYSDGWLLNIRGTNGSGKSTLPMMLLAGEPNPIVLNMFDAQRGKEIPVATYLPLFNIALCGTYFNKTGGLDVLDNNAQTRLLVELLWGSGANVIMEGVIASTIRSTYVDLFTHLVTEKPQAKRVLVVHLQPDVETCVERVIQRNGGNTEINTQLIRNKYRMVSNAQKGFEACEHVKTITVDNSNWDIGDTIDRYMELLDGVGVRLV